MTYAADASPAPIAFDRPAFLGIVLAGFIFFALNVDFRPSGDAVMYADYVSLAKFDELTLHIGYYALVFAVQRTLGTVLGIPVHETMVWINVAFGALALGVTYHLSRHFLGSRTSALLSSAILLLCGRVIMNATSSEVYMMQTCLVMLSFLLFVNERIVIAGLVAGIAMLVTPLSAFAFLFFPVFDYTRAGRVRWRLLALLAAAALVVYIPYLAVYGSELLWGRRGLLDINSDVPLEPLAMLASVPRFAFKHYTLLLLLLIPALAAVRAYKSFLAVTSAVVIPHMYVVSKLTSEDNVFLLCVDFFIACWMVIGWRQLARSKVGRLVAPLPLAGHVALLIASGTIFGFEPHREYAGDLRGFARSSVLGRDATVITDWDTGMALTYFGRPAATSTIERDPLYKQMFDINAPERSDPRSLDAPDLYLLDRWEPGPLRRFLISDEAIAVLRRQHGVLSIAQQRFNIECVFIGVSAHPLYKCKRMDTSAPAPWPSA